MDIVDHKTRSRMMAGIRAKDTRPEMMVRAFLHSEGFRYRLHCAYLPGKPDIVLPKYRIAIFVHGCFWHRHNGCAKATTPKSNIEKWEAKFAENVARDKNNVPALIELDWRVAVIWECGLSTKAFQESMAWLIGVIRESHNKFNEWPIPK